LNVAHGRILCVGHFEVLLPIVDPSPAQLRDFRIASISGGEMTLWVNNCHLAQ
jgi:hypothetical protein